MDDLISRQDAIDAIEDWWITVGDNRHPVDVIKAVPSGKTLENAIDYLHSVGWLQEHDRILTASAQRKGKWIRENIVLTSTPPQYQWHCSGCGRLVRGFSTEILTDFCPNCGAEMKKGEEDEHNTNDNTGN